ENQGEGHGYFTKWLLKGLEGGVKDEATKNAAGEVTLGRLYAFVQGQGALDTRGQQHPVLVWPAALRSFPPATPLAVFEVCVTNTSGKPVRYMLFFNGPGSQGRVI